MNGVNSVNNARNRIFASRGIGRRLFGIFTQTSFAGVAVVQQLLHAHRTRQGSEIKWICELGSGCGSTTLFWAMWGFCQQKPVYSVEQDWERIKNVRAEAALEKLGVTVAALDVFSPEGIEYVRDRISRKKGLLICDNGNKPRELATFAPMTPAGSIICVHDFGPVSRPLIEVLPEHIEQVSEVEYYQPWHDESIELSTRFAILRRK